MKKFTLFFIALLATAAMHAQIIHIPGDYPTIQQGINAAIPGDTVLVSDGTYYEQINFLGKKPLMVASEFLIDGDTNHIANTIIDGSQLTNMDSASVVYFVSGEDTTSTFCGFTIQHGKGTYTPDNLDDRQGGGIWISHSGAKIIHNRITHNTLDDTQNLNGNSTAGAGICTFYEDAGYWVVIADNTIDSNTCISQYDYAVGGGIWINYNGRIINNVISHNSCTGHQNSVSQGGGLGCGQDSGWITPIVLIIENNLISHNLSQSDINWANTAGILIVSSTVLFKNNNVGNNTVNSGYLTVIGGTAGLGVFEPEEGCLIANNTFRENISNRWAGGLHLQSDFPEYNSVLVENNYFLDNEAYRGGAFTTIDVPVILQNNVFSGNHASFGGAMFLDRVINMDGFHLAILINNSFNENMADNSGGAVYSYKSGLLIYNTIFFNDKAAGIPEEIFLALGTDTVEIAASNIDMSLISGKVINGGDNINEDPMYNSTSLLTTESWSPCVDKGVQQYTCSHGQTYYSPIKDILGNLRPVGTGIDMGAYDIQGSGLGSERITNYELRIANYPNPFNRLTTFLYTLSEPGQVTFQIYNGFGQLLAEPVNEIQATGEHAFHWNAGDLPAGIYYYQMKAGGMIRIGKMVKVK